MLESDFGGLVKSNLNPPNFGLFCLASGDLDDVGSGALISADIKLVEGAEVGGVCETNIVFVVLLELSVASDSAVGKLKLTCLLCLGLFWGDKIETGVTSLSSFASLEGLGSRSSTVINRGVSFVITANKRANLFFLATSKGLSSNTLYMLAGSLSS